MCYWTHGTRTRYGVTENNRLFYFIFLTFRSPSTRPAGLFDFVFWCCLNIFPRVGQRIKCVKRSGRHRCPLIRWMAALRNRLAWHLAAIHQIGPAPTATCCFHSLPSRPEKKKGKRSHLKFIRRYIFGFNGFRYPFQGYYLGFTGLRQVLLGFTGFYWVLLGFE